LAYLRDKQEDLAKLVKPTKNCTGFENLTSEEVEADNELGSNSQGLVECYCREEFSRRLTDGICQDWAFDYYMQRTLPFLAVLAVVLANFFIQFLFRALASFEKHRNKTTEFSSRVVKIFMA